MVAVWAMVLAVGVSSVTISLAVSPNVVIALVNGPELSNDLNDGHGNSHYSRVVYSRSLNPWDGIVDYVTIGGRHEDDSDFPCSGEEKWKSDKTKYRRWDGSRWITEETKSDVGWRTTGTPGLAFFTLEDNVALSGGGLVEHTNKYRLVVRRWQR